MHFLSRIFVRFGLVVLMALFIFLCHQTIIGASNYHKKKIILDQLDGEVKSLKLEKAKLNGELKLLNEDSSYYEQLAREEFGMIKNGELVYISPLP